MDPQRKRIRVFYGSARVLGIIDGWYRESRVLGRDPTLILRLKLSRGREATVRAHEVEGVMELWAAHCNARSTTIHDESSSDEDEDENKNNGDGEKKAREADDDKDDDDDKAEDDKETDHDERDKMPEENDANGEHDHDDDGGDGDGSEQCEKENDEKTNPKGEIKTVELSINLKRIPMSSKAESTQSEPKKRKVSSDDEASSLPLTPSPSRTESTKKIIWRRCKYEDCKKKFQSAGGLRNHEASIHKENRCQSCEKKVSLSNMANHVKKSCKGKPDKVDE